MALLLHRSDCLVAIKAADLGVGLDQASPRTTGLSFRCSCSSIKTGLRTGMLPYWERRIGCRGIAVALSVVSWVSHGSNE
jgi:hypothetical protein